MASSSATPDEFLPTPLPVARERWWLHLLLFALTFACVAELQYLAEGNVKSALAFAISLLTILTCHEFGHYFLGRFHGVSISPPYFIPVPLGIGTFGAVIRIRSEIPNRNALVDIGAAGPIAGMLIAVPLLFWGTAHSHYAPVPYLAGTHLPGSGSLWALGHAFWRGAQTSGLGGGWHALGAQFNPDHGSGWSGDSLLSWIAQRVLLGPRPAGMDLVLHPVADAAWWGMLVTMLNLLPVGQLDGGHVSHAIFGRNAEKLGNLVHVLMVGMMVVASWNWIVWFLLTRYMVGVSHPEVTQPQEPMSRLSWGIAALSLLMLALVLIPVPVEMRGLR